MKNIANNIIYWSFFVSVIIANTKDMVVPHWFYPTIGSALLWNLLGIGSGLMILREIKQNGG